jgi:hypothetical protein
MKTTVNITSAALLALALAAGCSETPQATTSGKSPAKKSEEGHDHHEHAHASTGPHGGPVIELGKEDYHAELVHDEAVGTVTIYILDHEAKAAVAIDAKELRINLKHDGKGEQFKLAASPQEGDEAEKSSRFVSEDKHLGEDLDGEGTEARLVVEIDGKSYTGKIEHKHDHDHDHEEGGHKH